MLTNFLRDLYKSKTVSKQILENNLKNWNFSQNKLTKTFVFCDFQQAMTFMNLAANYVDENKIEAKISNVYNKVSVDIEEKAISHLTNREYKTAVFLDGIGEKFDIIEDIVNTDYYSSHQALPEKFNLDINNLVPTDPWAEKDKYIHSDRNSQLKLI